MTATTTITTRTSWRRTGSGEWVVFGPTDAVHVGTVIVTKRSGESQTVTVSRVGRSFATQGRQCCYGYVAATGGSRDISGAASQECDNCGSGRGIHRRVDSSGIPGLVCGTCSRGASYMLSFA